MSENNNFVGADVTDRFENEDIEKNKTMAGLAYLVFFLPLITCPDSKFAKYHSNQALILLIFGIASSIIAFILIFVPIVGGLIGWLMRIVFLVYWVLGLVDAFGGKAKQFPFIGEITIIK